MESVYRNVSRSILVLVSLMVLGAPAAEASHRKPTRSQKAASAVRMKVEFLGEESVGALEPEELTNDLMLESVLAGNSPSTSALGGIFDGVTLDQLVNYGKQFWAFLEANKPVVNFQTASANALPAGVTSAYDPRLIWPANATRVKAYRISFTDIFGSEVGSFEFRVVYTYGGSIGGRGLYLSSVKIVPGNVNVGWGNTLNAKVEVSNIYATGSRQSPTAVMELYFSWNMSNILKNMSGSRSLIVRGDGSFQDITDGN